jgi:hypothetical protein
VAWNIRRLGFAAGRTVTIAELVAAASLRVADRILTASESSAVSRFRFAADRIVDISEPLVVITWGELLGVNHLA